MYRLIEAGAHEGSPAIQDWPLAGEPPGDMVARLASVRAPGARFITLEGAVPWGRGLDAALAHLASAERTADLVVHLLRPIGEQNWPAVQCWVALDCSALMRAPHTSETIAWAVDLAADFPPPSELVVVDPLPCNLSPDVLDALASRCRPDGECWLYVSPDQIHAASHAIVQAAPGWAVRVRRPGSGA